MPAVLSLTPVLAHNASLCPSAHTGSEARQLGQHYFVLAIELEVLKKKIPALAVCQQDG